MWISFKVISAYDLLRPTNQEVVRKFYLPSMTMEGFQENIQRVSGSMKPVVIVNGLFYWHEQDLVDEAAFLVHDGPASLICSFVENTDDGFAKAIEAIQQELNVN